MMSNFVHTVLDMLARKLGKRSKMLTEVKLAHVWLKVNIFSSNCIDVVIIKHSEPKIKHKNKKWLIYNR